MHICRFSAWLVLLVGVVGCGGTPTPADTGARHVVQEYCDAVIHRDWNKAYAVLQPDSRKLWTAEQYSRSAEAYRRKLGFEPEKAHVRSCEEQGTHAIAHVVFTGNHKNKQLRFKDGVVLRLGAEGWRVVPRNASGK